MRPSLPPRRHLALLAAACLALVLALPGATASATTFGSPVGVAQANTGEPGINVAGDGAIYVNAPSGLLSNLPGSPSFVWRSTDGGGSWTLLPAGMRGSFAGGGDSNVSVDPGDPKTLYMTDLWLGSDTVSVSHDQGESWTANPLSGVVVEDRQWIAAAGGNVVYHATHQIPAGLVVSKSVDGGASYPVSNVAATPVDQTGCVCPPGNLIAQGGTAPAGTGDKVGLIYSTSSGGVKFAQSANGGLTWTNNEVGPATNNDTTESFPVVANAGSNKLVAVWQEVLQDANGNPKGTDILFSASNDWGSSWSAPKVLVSGGTTVYPWIDARGSKVSVSLYQTPTVAGDSQSVPDSAQWFETYLESTDGGASWSAPQTVDPAPVKTGKICTGGIGCSGNRQLLDFQSIALDGSGNPDLAYTRVLGDNRTSDQTDTLFAHGTSITAASQTSRVKQGARPPVSRLGKGGAGYHPAPR
jgi:hypothetical protein